MQEISVTELLEILEKHFGKHVTIEYVEVASIRNQYNPQKLKVGIGGILTIYYEE